MIRDRGNFCLQVSPIPPYPANCKHELFCPSGFFFFLFYGGKRAKTAARVEGTVKGPVIPGALPLPRSQAVRLQVSRVKSSWLKKVRG